MVANGSTSYAEKRGHLSAHLRICDFLVRSEEREGARTRKNEKPLLSHLLKNVMANQIKNTRTLLLYGA